MYLLATDTSGKNGSIALASCHPGGMCDVLEMVPLEGGTFSAQLIPQIVALLSKHTVGKSDVDAFAVATGPGSFTGLRIGLAAIKGLSEILHKPIAAVSLLEALVCAVSEQARVIAAMGAGRGEYYVGVYESEGSQRKLVDERLQTQGELLDSARDCVLVTPDCSLTAAAQTHGIEVLEVRRPESDAVARLGWEKIKAGRTVTPEILDANYIRRAVDPIAVKP